MRLISFTYKNYPLSKELTAKSKRIGTLSHPIMGIALAGLLGIAAASIFPTSVTAPGIIIIGGMIVFPILLGRNRKKQFAKLDEEYQKILQNKG